MKTSAIDLEKADDILKGTRPIPPCEELQALIKALKNGLAFGRARRLIARALGRDARPATQAEVSFAPRETLWLTQQLALCTYKDEELLPGRRFKDALAILSDIGLRRPETSNPETLALGGAVFKRKFEFAGQLDDLQESLALYRAGWERKSETEAYIQERAYAGVNAAYVLDILTERARTIALRTNTAPTQADGYAAEARQLRLDVLAYLDGHFGKPPRPEQTYWDAVTQAEVYFGLRRYEEARERLQYASAHLPSSPWERQTTFKQLVGLARMQQVGAPEEGSSPEHWAPAWQALHAFLGQDAETASSCYRGKVGLALSGGGFRASLFHIGVLARLAEMDVLRYVEVLSTVSGGSIVGAHYYLEVQHLLETRPDRAEQGTSGTEAPRPITREDYIQIVRRLQATFLKGVDNNLRMQALSDFGDNLKMLFSNTFTRSNRMGKLYERQLFSAVADGKGSADRTMTQLLVSPYGTDGSEPFDPRFSNWQRRAKVPVLLLNATSLNSGHNWQFTASWMGEPPGLFEPDSDIDANIRYRRLYYGQAPTEELKAFRLGDAVAASACVPGIFEPLVLKGLYPGRTVRLVDGGVHDNQGIEALLDEGCTIVLCSDASGQMGDLERPSDTFIGVPLRANGILQDRIRESEFQDLRGRVENRALQGLFFIHLKKDLHVAPLNWIGCTDVIPVQDRSLTSYQVDRDIQRRLAAIRTDLDSFSETEAYALMTSGYLMTDHTMADLQREHQAAGGSGTWGDFAVGAAREQWSFLDLADLMKQPSDSGDLRRQDLALQLEAGSGLFFKVWRLVPALRALAFGAAFALALVLLCSITRHWDVRLPALDWNVTVGGAITVLALSALGMVVPLVKWMNPQSAVRGYLMKAAMALAGFVASRVHLAIFNPLYLERGRIARLLRLQ